MGKQWKQCQTLVFWAPESLQMVTAAMKLKDAYSLEKEMATHSSILAWKIPWMEEPGVLQFMGSQSGTRLSDFTHSLTRSAYKLNKQGDNIQP